MVGVILISNNTTIKVKGKVASAYTVLAGEYVIATYTYQGSTGSIIPFAPAQVYYAPGDSVAATIAIGTGGGSATLTLVTAVAFVNTP
jgi:hypothetical protein